LEKWASIAAKSGYSDIVDKFRRCIDASKSNVPENRKLNSVLQNLSLNDSWNELRLNGKATPDNSLKGHGLDTTDSNPKTTVMMTTPEKLIFQRQQETLLKNLSVHQENVMKSLEEQQNKLTDVSSQIIEGVRGNKKSIDTTKKTLDIVLKELTEVKVLVRDVKENQRKTNEAIAKMSNELQSLQLKFEGTYDENEEEYEDYQEDYQEDSYVENQPTQPLNVKQMPSFGHLDISPAQNGQETQGSVFNRLGAPASTVTKNPILATSLLSTPTSNQVTQPAFGLNSVTQPVFGSMSSAPSQTVSSAASTTSIKSLESSKAIQSGTENKAPVSKPTPTVTSFGSSTASTAVSSTSETLKKEAPKVDSKATPVFGGQTVFGMSANTSFGSQENAKPLFGVSSSSTSTQNVPSSSSNNAIFGNTSTSIFGGTTTPAVFGSPAPSSTSGTSSGGLFSSPNPSTFTWSSGNPGSNSKAIFGNVSTTDKNDAKKDSDTGFKFKLDTISPAAASPFASFAASTASMASASTPSGFQWGGLSEKPSWETNKPAQIFGQKNEEEDAQEDGSDEEDEHDPQFAPVIPLPSLVEVKTGEEDEEVIYSQRAKLYRFDADLKQWKERGLGDFKILKHTSKNRFRMLLRREQVHKIACNHYLTKEMSLKPFPNSETSVVWTAMDFSDEEPATFGFAVRFKNVDLLNAFVSKFEECQQQLD